MPPTLAAARNTACGRLAANHLFTAAWSRRSTSARVNVCSSTSSCARRRTSADPTMPRWPATKTVLPFSSNGILAIGDLPPRDLEIGGHHLLDQGTKRGLRLPAEFFARLAGVADQKIDLGRPEIDGIDAHHRLAGAGFDAGLVDALAAPFDAAADLGKGEFNELTHRMRLAGCQHEIIRRIRLQDHVHAFDIIARVAPVALGFKIAEIERLLEAGFDACHAAGDLAGDE